jgi:hypothetical protein
MMTVSKVNLIKKELLSMGFTQDENGSRSFTKWHKLVPITVKFQKAYDTYYDAYVRYGITPEQIVIETTFFVEPSKILKRSEDLATILNFLDR